MSEQMSAADQVGALINKGKWRKAQNLAEYLRINDQNAQHDARFWFQYALVELLRGDKNGHFADFREQAGGCYNYRSWMDGDFSRDLALFYMRKGKLEIAEELLEIAADHAEDWNHITVIKSIEARIASKCGDFNNACRLHREANDAWTLMTDGANEQWIKNNTFHWLRAVIERGGYTREYIKEMYSRVKAGDAGNRNRLIGAWLAYRIGKTGNRIFDLADKLLR